MTLSNAAAAASVSDTSANQAAGNTSSDLGALHQVPYMGVIYVIAEAVKLGYENGHPDWCNLGQGQPEVGPMEGAPERILSVDIEPEDCAYGPLEGIPDLRQAVADTYNRQFRVGKSSQYGPENVAIASGGRLALTRAMAALAPGHVGFQLPDYTAYEDMFNLHLDRITALGVRGAEDEGFAVTAKRLEQAILEDGLSSFVFSNPCNPTGRVLSASDRAAYAELARRHNVTLFSDEFYSHFVYETAGNGKPATPAGAPVSLASDVNDVNSDPVLIFDGLTKNHRYPGWRLGWILGPPELVEATARTASSIDGGPSRIAQRAAIQALKQDRADQETAAMRNGFCAKRNRMIEVLTEMGVRFASETEGTFYCWGDLSNLPAPFNTGDGFFRAALQAKVLTVPGSYFDINPGKRRKGTSPFHQWMRFSFGPPMDNLELGLQRLRKMVQA